jgi:uncharacterized damage-inducible protein DinB
MTTIDKREVWQRGPVENVPALLQPVAHALLQARDEVEKLVVDFPNNYLWHRPAGVASVGFHFQHLAGVVDRLFTYARGGSLSEAQLKTVASEGRAIEGITNVAELVEQFKVQVNMAISELGEINVQTLTEVRMVGLTRIPSTVIGLLFHAAEHTMRHVGQVYVTVKVIENSLAGGL